MDSPILNTPALGALLPMVEQAGEIYHRNFNDEAWFGRCIFLSWYCERGTCTFCFRNTQKQMIRKPAMAIRSIPSILSEAMLIKGLGWRLEFLTGGYGILNDEMLLRTTMLVHEMLGEKLWINLGEISTDMLEEFRPYVEGIVSSIETVEPRLHKKVCPDKPIKPYVDMMVKARKLGFKLSIAIIIGLGEKKKDLSLLSEFIEKNKIERITVYALRPVKGTPFTKGPDPLDMVWWIANIRIAFPKIEIIAGTAVYRIPEISLLLRAGANAITKLPVVDIFNTDLGKMVEEEVRKAGRRFVSKFSSKDVRKEADWDKMMDIPGLTEKERKNLEIVMGKYLRKISK
ncbi:MAG: radical SAM protein [archaeon]